MQLYKFNNISKLMHKKQLNLVNNFNQEKFLNIFIKIRCLKTKNNYINFSNIKIYSY
jgi:cytochrome c-type biogenesis protein CcmH/NrfF